MAFEQYESPTDKVEAPAPAPVYSDTSSSNASYTSASTHLSDIATYQLHAVQISGANTEAPLGRPGLLEIGKPSVPGESPVAKPITSEMMKDRFAKFESLMKHSPPPEDTAETVRDIGKALIKGDVKGIQDALAKVTDEKQLQAIADYLYGALGVQAQAIPGKGLKFELNPESAGGGLGRGNGYIARPRADSYSISISIYPDKVDAVVRSKVGFNDGFAKLSDAEAGSELQNAIFNPHRYRNPSRDQKGDQNPQPHPNPQTPGIPSSRPERNPESRPSGPVPSPESTGPAGTRDNVPPRGPEARPPAPEAPASRPEAPAPKPEAPAPRDVELMQKLRNLEEFKVRWNESLGTLDKTPFGPVMRELGQQLASGKLNVEAIQKLLKQVKISEEDLPAMAKLLASFNQNMQEMYGFGVSFGFAGKGNEITLTGVQVETGGANSTKLSIGLTGDAKGTQAGIAGTTETDAMKRYQELIRGGRQDTAKK
jgi:hypothetical protein